MRRLWRAWGHAGVTALLLLLAGTGWAQEHDCRIGNIKVVVQRGRDSMGFAGAWIGLVAKYYGRDGKLLNWTQCPDLNTPYWTVWSDPGGVRIMDSFIQYPDWGWRMLFSRPTGYGRHHVTIGTLQGDGAGSLRFIGPRTFVFTTP